jgi:5'-phosphate synthase pdxT subunit
MKRIGILALQGAFAEHKKMLEELGTECIELRKQSDLQRRTVDGIVLPGGESTVIGKLLKDLNMLEELQTRITEGLPVFGTCAGLILLAKNIIDEPNTYLATMDIRVKRNAYGRQLGSFQVSEEFIGVGPVSMVFIRAPYIDEVRGDAEILAKVNGNIVAARQKNMFVTSFHPELTSDHRIHKYFLDMI